MGKKRALTFKMSISIVNETHYIKNKQINSERGFLSPCTSDCPFHPAAVGDRTVTDHMGGVHSAHPSETFKVVTVQVPFCLLRVTYNQEI